MSDTVPLPSTPVTQIWRPSAVRLITLDAAVPTARGTPAQLPLTWPVKDPDDVLDYQFDLADVLNGFGRSYAGDGPCSDSIATLDVSIHPADPGDLALTSAAADGLRCVLWLSGGQAGVTYTVTPTALTVASGESSAGSPNSSSNRSQRIAARGLPDAASAARRIASPSGSQRTVRAVILVLSDVDGRDGRGCDLGALERQAEAGAQVLLDDRRQASPGVKFKDAELIGVPTIVVVGRGLADGTIELKDRRSGERRNLEVDSAVAEILAEVGRS